MSIMKINSKYQGYVAMFITVLFLLLSLAVISGVNLLAGQTARLVGQSFDSIRAYFLSESGSEDAIYRLRSAKVAPPSFNVWLDGHQAAVTLAEVEGNKEIVSIGTINDTQRQIKNILVLGSGASFNFGVQSGRGGFVMANNSTIEGNLYSNGPVTGFNSGLIKGSVISAGPTGLIDGITATGTAYAHTIKNANIGGDAYYQSISLTEVGGDSYPNSPDQATTSLPISDEQIEKWKNDAALGGEIDCAKVPYRIREAVTLGPVKINCDLEISGNNYDVTLAGNVWVKGSISISNSPTIRILDSIGARSVAMIADNPNDRINSSRVILNNEGTFLGSGRAGSYILMISQNNAAEMGGGPTAVEVLNSIGGDLLVYAGHGEIILNNYVDLKQVTAYLIRLSNFSIVKYAIGLASILFTSGPGGTWRILSWFEM